jgi:hypothetical protein
MIDECDPDVVERAAAAGPVIDETVGLRDCRY